jgi:ATP-dependent DNA ligase
VGTGTTPPPCSAPSTCSKWTARTCGASPIEERKGILAKLLSHPHEGIAFNEHQALDGAIIFKHACALGCEGIVSKRLGSAYRSGRADCWIKVKNPAAPAVTREAEEDWSK